jgi:hypothetical protein
MLVVRGDSERGAGKDVGRLSRSRLAVAKVLRRSRSAGKG